VTDRTAILASPAAPQPSDTTSVRADRHALYILVSGFLIVLGFKLLLIGNFNPITPFWDQWDAEGAVLYTPIIEGHFNWAVLISSQNEHRILFTRITNLGVFYGVGLWYPALQMVVNSFIHCTTIFIVVYLLTRGIKIYARSIAILAMTLVYVIPFDVENTLAGFQSQFYFVILFSVLSIYLISEASAFSGMWIAGLMLSVASYFSMSSGSLTAVTASVVMALQLAVGARRPSAREYVAVSVCVLLSVIEVLNMQVVAFDDAQYGAHALSAFVKALIVQMSYPFHMPYGLLQYTPSVILLFQVLKRKPGLRAYEWSALAIVLWLASQLIAISYGRSIAVKTSRYTDTQILGLVANLGIAFYLLRNRWSTHAVNIFDRWRWLLILCVMVVALGAGTIRFGRIEYARARTFGEHLRRQTENTKTFLQTGDISALQDKPFLDVPYPDPQRLAILLSEPTIRSILHPDLTGRPLRQDLLLPVWLSKIIRDVLLLVMHSGRIFIGIGIGMWLAVPVASQWSRERMRRKQTAGIPNRAP